jgi:hypothetical protein
MIEPGSGWFGIPAMLAYVIVFAVITTATSVITAILAAVGIVLLFLAIGLAMTIAKRSE